MRETGILSIVRRGDISQVRYASFNPYDLDRLPYQCSNETALVALLHHWGIDPWSLQQAIAALRKGEVAVLRVALSEAQLQAYFPPQHAPRVGRDAREGRQPDASSCPARQHGLQPPGDVGRAGALVQRPAASICDPIRPRLAALTRPGQR